MSFDRYFENTEKQLLQHNDHDDWYAIVEEALDAADVASSQNRQRMEANLMKPLPKIPEDVADEPIIVESPYDPTRRPSSVYSMEMDTIPLSGIKRNTDTLSSGHRMELQIPPNYDPTRRPSSVYSLDFDSPLSPESNALDSWASDMCLLKESTCCSLRRKPVTRQSTSTRSASSTWSAPSVGSSVMASRRRSTSSSIYSADTSVDSYGSSARSVCMASPDLSNSPTSSSKKVRFEEEASASFFDFSDDEDEEKQDVTVARPESSTSSYVKNLRRKALSLRIATSKMANGQVRMTSLSSNEVPTQKLSSWLSRSSTLDRVSRQAPSECLPGSENQLMAGAAQSARARRVLGLR